MLQKENNWELHLREGWVARTVEEQELLQKRLNRIGIDYTVVHLNNSCVFKMNNSRVIFQSFEDMQEVLKELLTMKKEYGRLKQIEADNKGGDTDNKEL